MKTIKLLLFIAFKNYYTLFLHLKLKFNQNALGKKSIFQLDKFYLFHIAREQVV